MCIRDRCNFGEQCSFGERCNFGGWCGFGERCNFGGWCGFGERCSFGKWCSHEGLTNSRYVAVDRIGSQKRKTYFFAADGGVFVRAGCFFGTADEFTERVKWAHKGTRHEREYLLALELAKVMLEEAEK